MQRLVFGLFLLLLSIAPASAATLEGIRDIGGIIHVTLVVESKESIYGVCEVISEKYTKVNFDECLEETLMLNSLTDPKQPLGELHQLVLGPPMMPNPLREALGDDFFKTAAAEVAQVLPAQPRVLVETEPKEPLIAETLPSMPEATELPPPVVEVPIPPAPIVLPQVSTEVPFVAQAPSEKPSGYGWLIWLYAGALILLVFAFWFKKIRKSTPGRGQSLSPQSREEPMFGRKLNLQETTPASAQTPPAKPPVTLRASDGSEIKIGAAVVNAQPLEGQSDTQPSPAGPDSAKYLRPEPAANGASTKGALRPMPGKEPRIRSSQHGLFSRIRDSIDLAEKHADTLAMNDRAGELSRGVLEVSVKVDGAFVESAVYAEGPEIPGFSALVAPYLAGRVSRPLDEAAKVIDEIKMATHAVGTKGTRQAQIDGQMPTTEVPSLPLTGTNGHAPNGNGAGHGNGTDHHASVN